MGPAERGVALYGKVPYGLSKYAQDEIEGQYRDEYFHDVSKYVPDYLITKRELQATCHAEGYEVGLAYHNIRDMFDQLFFHTASWGLVRWENMYGVITNMSLSYEQRREILSAKVRGRGTTTKAMVEATAVAFSGGEVEVIEDNPNSQFIVRFIGIKGIPRNMQAFIGMLEEIKPAHLKCRFEYTYTTWNSLRPFVWNDLLNKTWDQLRTMREVEYSNGTWHDLGINTWNMIAWKTWEEIGKE